MKLLLGNWALNLSRETFLSFVSLGPELICSGNRQRQYSEARSVLAWLAVEEVGHTAAEVARFLGISRVGVQKAVIRESELKGNQVSLG